MRTQRAALIARMGEGPYKGVYSAVSFIAIILDQGGHPGTRTGSGPEFSAVDKFGNIFAGEPRPRVLRKYVKVR